MVWTVMSTCLEGSDIVVQEEWLKMSNIYFYTNKSLPSEIFQRWCDHIKMSHILFNSRVLRAYLFFFFLLGFEFHGNPPYKLIYLFKMHKQLFQICLFIHLLCCYTFLLFLQASSKKKKEKRALTCSLIHTEELNLKFWFIHFSAYDQGSMTFSVRFGTGGCVKLFSQRCALSFYRSGSLVVLSLLTNGKQPCLSWALGDAEALYCIFCMTQTPISVISVTSFLPAANGCVL